MTGSAIDPRLLFSVAPADYVTERTRLAKQARTNGDKEGAKVLAALKRPATAMWGVLAAGVDVKAVHRVIEATAALAELQAAGGDSTSVAEAVGRRRAAVGTLVESAITELARWDVEARQRRQEIRDLVDQLARRSDVAASWIDGTLRDLPEHEIGFDAFANVIPLPRPEPAEPVDELPIEEKPVNDISIEDAAADDGAIIGPPEEAPEPKAPPVDELAVRRAAAREKAPRESDEKIWAEAKKAADREAAEREAAKRERAERERAERLAFVENARRLADIATEELNERADQLDQAEETLRLADVSHAAAIKAHAAAEQRHRAAVALLKTLTDEIVDGA
jgi:hypothetical protein